MQAKGAPEELFQFTVADEQMDWIFELKPDNTDLLNYMAVDEERRSLRDLVLDMDSQVEAMAERWFRRNDNNERAIRKMTEKLLKYLEVHLSAFAADVHYLSPRSKKTRNSSRTTSRRCFRTRSTASVYRRRQKIGCSILW